MTEIAIKLQPLHRKEHRDPGWSKISCLIGGMWIGTVGTALPAVLLIDKGLSVTDYNAYWSVVTVIGGMLLGSADWNWTGQTRKIPWDIIFGMAFIFIGPIMSMITLSQFTHLGMYHTFLGFSLLSILGGILLGIAFRSRA